MTSRLLGRCARLLGQCSQVPVAWVRPLAPPALAEPLPALALRLPTPCPWRTLCVAVDEGYQPAPDRTELDQLLEGAGTPGELLQVWEEHRGTANQAASALTQLARLTISKGVRDKREITDNTELFLDPRFQHLLQTVNSQVSTVWNGSLVALVRALSQLGMSPTAPALRSLQTEAHWRLRRLSYKQLAVLADWGSIRQRAGQEGALLGDVLKQLELRWTEITEPRTLALLMSHVGHLSPPLMERLEDKVRSPFSVFLLLSVAHSLHPVFQWRRSVPLLRALSYHLLQKPGLELPTPLLLDLAFAYGKLNFQQTQLFQRIAAELLPRLPELSPNQVVRCAKSFTFLKWLHLPLFEGFTEHFLQHSENYSATQLCNLIMAFARLNFQPSQGDAFYSKVLSKLEGVLHRLAPVLHMDAVWSLCVLQQTRPQLLRPLLEPSFHCTLTKGSPSHSEGYRLKLLHIAAALELECGEPRAALPAPYTTTPTTTRDSRPSTLQTSLQEALQILTGGEEGAYRTAVNTVYGWPIDGELVLDSESKPLRLDNLSAPHLPGGGGGTPLPEGARRIAVLAREFPHYSSRSRELLGRYVMQQRHLRLAGFLTVEVPYFEWLELKSDWQRVACLKDKIGKVVAEEMAK
ncbi:FAKD4 protein, partial [Amia calva]|nr:FAKD4 protein [Amia calva]